ncbi:MAG: AAC(3)-I family aminoglycoside N-acetyltransferase [Pseudanabaenaceae cyanobacterium bins.68]|nr:AAC(3)-I family aminoglycoside N-acetyltransferase [Pseudanabaenaceae cyanobacterium bins.68]
MTTEIYQLQAHDLDLFRAISVMFGEAFDQGDIYVGKPPADQYLHQLLASDYLIAIAAISSGVVVGGIVAYELKKFEQQRQEIYLYDLAVAASYRRQGIARAMIAQLQVIAKERGAYVIFVQADLEDEGAIALYEQFGKGAEVLHFDIPCA